MHTAKPFINSSCTVCKANSTALYIDVKQVWRMYDSNASRGHRRGS